jgi:hypothetical protein
LGLTLNVNVEGRRALKEAVAKLHHGEHPLNDPGRSFIRQGKMLKRANRSGRCVECQFFLFSDMLIHAKKIGGSSQCDVHEELPVILMKVVCWFPPELKKESKGGFQIFHPRKNLFVLRASKEERKSWIDAVCTAVDQEMERKFAIEAARMAAAKTHQTPTGNLKHMFMEMAMSNLCFCSFRHFCFRVHLRLGKLKPS